MLKLASVASDDFATGVVIVTDTDGEETADSMPFIVPSDSMLQAIEPVPAAMDLNVATTMEAPLPILASYSTKLTPSLLK